MVSKASKGGAHKKDPDYGSVRVFVYGTLKKGKCNNIVIRNSNGIFLGYDTMTIPSAAFMDLGGFPAMIAPIEGQTASQLIRGEIWYGPKEILQSCDILEGHPLFFRRTKHWSDTLRRRCWIYMLPESWIAEGEDFLPDSSWHPEDDEKAYWKKLEA